MNWGATTHYMASVIGKLLVACLALFVASSHANFGLTDVGKLKTIDRDQGGTYNFSLVGQFERGDGAVINAGISKTGVMLNPATKCSFVFPDKTRLSVGKDQSICLVRTKGSFALIYRYEATFPLESFFPFASKVEKYDGYDFVDITTARTRLTSAIVHVQTFSRDYLYLVALVLILVFLRLANQWIVKQDSEKWWLAFVRGAGRFAYLATVIACVLLITTAQDQRTLLSVNLFILCSGVILYLVVGAVLRRQSPVH